LAKIQKTALPANSMLYIKFPAHDFRLKNEGGKEFIFDELRKLWTRLTPEEWVRQNMLQYLVQEKKYPASLIAVEKEIMLGELRKRFDILIYKESIPWMVIECKEMDTPLNELVLRQALNYNTGLQTQYIVITNGGFTYGFALKDGNASMLEEFPSY
jgi:hypothetical protein